MGEKYDFIKNWNVYDIVKKKFKLKAIHPSYINKYVKNYSIFIEIS